MEREDHHNGQRDNYFLNIWDSDFGQGFCFLLKHMDKTLHLSQIYLIIIIMKLHKRAPAIITTQAIVATLWSLYYWWFGDPVINYYYQEWFVRSNGLTPCDMCWFARILMYPLVILGIIAWKRDDGSMYAPILVMSGLWIILEYYQYWFQMTNTVTEVKSVICGVSAEASCAATDVMYGWWLTIPLLCLIAFIVIFVTTAYAYRHHLTHHKNNH